MKSNEASSGIIGRKNQRRAGLAISQDVEQLKTNEVLNAHKSERDGKNLFVEAFKVNQKRVKEKLIGRLHIDEQSALDDQIQEQKLDEDLMEHINYYQMRRGNEGQKKDPNKSLQKKYKFTKFKELMDYNKYMDSKRDFEE